MVKIEVALPLVDCFEEVGALFLSCQIPRLIVSVLKMLLEILHDLVLEDVRTFRPEVYKLEQIRLIPHILLFDSSDCRQLRADEYILLILLFRHIDQPIPSHLPLPDHRIRYRVLHLDVMDVNSRGGRLLI